MSSRQPRTVGRMMGYRIARKPLREMMPDAETNPWLWFAWDGDDIIVVGVRTKRELREALERYEAECEA